MPLTRMSSTMTAALDMVSESTGSALVRSNDSDEIIFNVQLSTTHLLCFDVTTSS